MIEIDGRQVEMIHVNYDNFDKYKSIIDHPIVEEEDLGVRMYVMVCKRFKDRKNPRGVKVEAFQKFVVKTYYSLIQQAKSEAQAKDFIDNVWVVEAIKGLLP